MLSDSRLVRRLPATLLLAVLLAGAWWAYHPGLSGGFQFDDFANLPVLGATGPVDDWATFWRYITSGRADPTGRPIALLSFLVDARDWPADPRPFLRTSILLHLFNAALLFLLLRRLGAALAGTDRDAPSNASAVMPATPAWMPDRITLAALLGAALWLLHPLFVSTTLYIVQREAMLPATFTLLGLLAWLRGRRRLLDGATARGLAWMLLGLGACTALGVLSKANGILLPALALVIEATVLRGAGRDREPRQRRRYRRAMWVLAGLPTAFVAFYLARAGYNGLAHGISSTRPWTLGQRLLTEPRVLMDYLQLLWLPRPFTPGLFNDQIHASASLFSPWTTLPCLLAVLGLIAGACLVRRRLPAVALAIGFYFVGQALESSTIALELYFEHRNYLPAMLMFWPLALWLCGVPQTPGRAGTARQGDSDSAGNARPARQFGTSTAGSARPTRRRGVSLTGRPFGHRGWAKAALAVLILAGLAAMTHARAEVWGNVHEQALLWARLNPGSPRAQANAAMAQMRAGHPARAAARLQKLLADEPDQVQLAFNLFGAQCQMGHVPPATLQAARTSLATTRNPGALLAHWFGRAIRQADHPPCPQLTLDTLVDLVHAAQSNPKLMAIHGRRQDLDSILGRIALVRHRPDQALRYFNRALEQDVRTTAAFEQAALLGSRGYPERGLAHLERYRQLKAGRHKASPRFDMPRIHAWVLEHEHYWQKEFVRLHRTLQEDARANP